MRLRSRVMMVTSCPSPLDRLPGAIWQRTRNNLSVYPSARNAITGSPMWRQHYGFLLPRFIQSPKIATSSLWKELATIDKLFFTYGLNVVVGSRLLPCCSLHPQGAADRAFEDGAEAAGQAAIPTVLLMGCAGPNLNCHPPPVQDTPGRPGTN